MPFLRPDEKAFLDVFLHEATNSPFNGPATQALHAIGVGITDIRGFGWAYHHEVGMTDFTWGHAADVAPPLPWKNREEVLRRDQEIQRLREMNQAKVPVRAAG